MEIGKIHILDRLDALRMALLFDSFKNGILYPNEWPHCEEYPRMWNTVIDDILSFLFLNVF